MNAFKTLKTSNLHTRQGIINNIFILCGGKFYLDYLLLTNPTSKNPIIKLLFGWLKKSYVAKDYEGRYSLAIILIVVHLIFFTVFLIADKRVSFSNTLVNLYPIIVQLYIGYRCWILKKNKQNCSITHQ